MHFFRKGLRKSIELIVVILCNFKYFFSGRPNAVIQFGNSLGDDLLCTIVARQLHEQGVKNIWMKTYYPDLFLNNPYFSLIIPVNGKKKLNRCYNKIIDESKARIIWPHYAERNLNTDRDAIPQKHIVEIMCERAGAKKPEIIKPFLFLSKSEIKNGKLFNRQICIQSSGSGSQNYMANKEWLYDRYTDVVSYCREKYDVIQLGAQSDPLIPGVIDMRGKTSLRQSAAILANSLFFIGLVGFLMHLARSVDCRSVIIYGGRENPNQSGYSNNINLFSEMSCSPCWLWNKCDFGRECMNKITALNVIDAIKTIETSIY
jgi:ADP-heptose:LPS heptosyltransferase